LDPVIRSAKRTGYAVEEPALSERSESNGTPKMPDTTTPPQGILTNETPRLTTAN